jgi:hypothetical protein
MPNAYRSHYRPAAQQLIPGADPYILSLVRSMCGAATPRSAGEPDLERRLQRRLDRHCEALGASFDRSAGAIEISQPLAADCQEIRVDRRCAPRRWAQAGRQRVAWASV